MKRRKERRERDPRHDRHHVIPRSRGGGSRNNLITVPVQFHRALHAVLGNLLPGAETEQFLAEVLTPGTSWTNRDLHNLRERIMRQRMAS